MKCVIFGSRSFTDYKALEKAVKESGFEITEILNGKAKGGDALGEQYGRLNSIKVTDYPADWNNLDVSNCKVKVNDYGKEYNALAGFNRNEQMACAADCGIALQDGDTNGTADMIRRMKDKGKPVFIVGLKEESRIEF